MINHDAMMLYYKLSAPPVTGDENYRELINSMGFEVLLDERVGSYQGDYLFLLEKDGLYGFLVFGYGSCSGCDALQACYDEPDKVGELRDSLARRIDWRGADDMIDYLSTKDWEDEFYCYDGEAEAFAKKAMETIRG